MTALPPNATIGILGNGQLGRMLCLAAARLGYRTHVYGPEADSPAEQVATETTVAAYDDESALAEFAKAVDVTTFEFENVPAHALAFLTSRSTVRPSARVLEVSQDRLKEKAFFAEIGAGTAPWKPIEGRADVAKALNDVAPPAVLKTARLGYDGKGQAKVLKAEDADAAWNAITGGPSKSKGTYAILESFVDFTCEISVIAARGVDGKVVCFEPAENVHANHMLATATVPAKVSAETKAAATALATKAAQTLDVVGLLALEMFVQKDGSVLCNEMAPRPHNSGHWTMDACGTDQFEQHIRAVAGLPLVDPCRLADVTTVNVIGDDVNHLEKYLTDANAHIHLYGKKSPRPGRKMGHVNLLRPKS